MVFDCYTVKTMQYFPNLKSPKTFGDRHFSRFHLPRRGGSFKKGGIRPPSALWKLISPIQSCNIFSFYIFDGLETKLIWKVKFTFKIKVSWKCIKQPKTCYLPLFRNVLPIPYWLKLKETFSNCKSQTCVILIFPTSSFSFH